MSGELLSRHVSRHNSRQKVKEWIRCSSIKEQSSRPDRRPGFLRIERPIAFHPGITPLNTIYPICIQDSRIQPGRASGDRKLSNWNRAKFPLANESDILLAAAEEDRTKPPISPDNS